MESVGIVLTRVLKNSACGQGERARV